MLNTYEVGWVLQPSHMPKTRGVYCLQVHVALAADAQTAKSNEFLWLGMGTGFNTISIQLRNHHTFGTSIQKLT